MRGCQRFAPAAVRYAVAYSEQLGKDGLFATRLWGEPLVLYRSEGDVVCVRDSCPHRSAPLSMGEVQDGVLRCFYHGWGFGAQGKCVAVPTIGGSGKVPASYCATNIATVERDGVLWVWRGNPLTADASKLPRRAAARCSGRSHLSAGADALPLVRAGARARGRRCPWTRRSTTAASGRTSWRAAWRASPVPTPSPPLHPFRPPPP